MKAVFNLRCHFQRCKEKYIGETGCLLKEQTNIYRQYIRKLQYQKLTVKEHLSTWGDKKFHMFPFFKILEDNKSLRKSYEDYFVEIISYIYSKLCSIK